MTTTTTTTSTTTQTDRTTAVARAVAALGPLVTARSLDGKGALPTPCEAFTVDQLGAHLLDVLSRGTHAARRTPWRPGPDGSWNRFDEVAGDLADAWSVPQAWEGEVDFYGSSQAARFAGGVMVMELVVHGWDVARALGVPFDADADLIRLALVAARENEAMGARDFGAFAPARLPQPASALDELAAFTGRDVGWRP
ncbi:TIGR03086 family metal-binding protein [Streptomyces sp. NPDC055189]